MNLLIPIGTLKLRESFRSELQSVYRESFYLDRNFGASSCRLRSRFVNVLNQIWTLILRESLFRSELRSTYRESLQSWFCESFDSDHSTKLYCLENVQYLLKNNFN